MVFYAYQYIHIDIHVSLFGIISDYIFSKNSINSINYAIFIPE